MEDMFNLDFSRGFEIGIKECKDFIFILKEVEGTDKSNDSGQEATKDLFEDRV